MIFQMNKNKTGLNHEIELLLCCARTQLNDDIRMQISHLIRGKINWVNLVHYAQDHDLIPLVYRNLTLVQDNFPDIIANFLKDQYNKQVKRNLLLTGELLQKINLLKEHEIFTVPYKGPVLANEIYGNLSLRSFKGLDIFIYKKDIKRIKEILQAHDYKPDLKEQKEKIHQKYYHECRFISENNAHIKFQWKIPKINLSLNSKISLDEPIEITFNNSKLLSITDEDLLLISCLNATNGLWLHLKNICDIRELVSRKNINWEHVLEKSELLGMKRILLLSLYLTNDLLDLKLPHIILMEIKNDYHKIQWISNDYKERLFSMADIEYTIFHDGKIKYNLRENRLNGIRDVLKTWITPTYDDLKNLNVPNTLNHVYYLYKPYHLLKNYKIFDKTKFSEYGPTPSIVVKEMFELANLSSDDVIYDLGCGDGRIIINAAKTYGTRGVGIDIDPKRISQSKENAVKEKVEDLTDFIQIDALKADLSPASVVTLYLYSSFLSKLTTKFEDELQSDTRIVAHNFEIRDWKPIKSKIIKHKDSISGIYLYRV